VKFNQRFLTVGLASVIGLGVLAPAASANDHGNRDLTIGLGVASVALLASHHYEAGAIGLGLTALAAGIDHRRRDYCDAPVRYVPLDRWRHDDDRGGRDHRRW